MNIDIERVAGEAACAVLPDLADVLHACVAQGASVGFIAPFTPEDSLAYWQRRVLPGVRTGGVALLVARVAGRVVGTVQLDCDTPANQPHRAEVRKLLVHPAARRGGIARALMAAVEADAAQRGRTLLTLDTRSGDHAEPLYRSLGYVEAGRIPGYARAADGPRLDATTIMYKVLPAGALRPAA